MKRNFLKSVTCIVFGLAAASCSGAANSEAGDASATRAGYVAKTFDVETFTGLAASQTIRVTYTPTTSQKVEVEAEIMEEVADNFSAEVSGGVLRLQFKNLSGLNTSDNEAAAYVKVTGPASLYNVTAHSCADINVTGTISSGSALSIEANSNASVEVQKVACPTLNVEAHSRGGIVLTSVDCDDVNAESHSTGNITMKSLVCENLDAESNSAGSVSIPVATCDRATFDVSSTGNITVSGKCKKRATMKASSMGTIDAADMSCPVVSASASSMGDIKCNATDKLQQNTASRGKVNGKENVTTRQESRRVM